MSPPPSRLPKTLLRHPIPPPPPQYPSVHPATPDVSYDDTAEEKQYEKIFQHENNLAFNLMYQTGERYNHKFIDLSFADATYQVHRHKFDECLNTHKPKIVLTMNISHAKSKRLHDKGKQLVTFVGDPDGDTRTDTVAALQAVLYHRFGPRFDLRCLTGNGNTESFDEDWMTLKSLRVLRFMTTSRLANITRERASAADVVENTMTVVQSTPDQLI